MPKGKRGGRVAGTRNRRTAELLALAAGGETPVEHALRVMRDPAVDPETRLHAAKVAAPYCHPRPNPERFVNVGLPAAMDGTGDALAVHAAVVAAVAAGELSLEAGQHLSAIIAGHLRIVEHVELEARIATLERNIK